MQLKIGSKEYQIHIGLAALEYLNKVYTMDLEGVEVGFALNKLYIDINLKNVLAIANFIKAGTITEAQKPSNEDIENFIGGMDIKKQDDFFEEIKSFLGKSPLTKARWGMIDQTVKENTKAKKD